MRHKQPRGRAAFNNGHEVSHNISEIHFMRQFTPRADLLMFSSRLPFFKIGGPISSYDSPEENTDCSFSFSLCPEFSSEHPVKNSEHCEEKTGCPFSFSRCSVFKIEHSEENSGLSVLKNGSSVCFPETCSLKDVSQIHKLEPRIHPADWPVFFHNFCNQKKASSVLNVETQKAGKGPASGRVSGGLTAGQGRENSTIARLILPTLS